MSYNICVITSDGTINRNQVSEISVVFLESEEVDQTSDLANDSSWLIVRLLTVRYDDINYVDYYTCLLSNVDLSAKNTLRAHML